MTTKNLKKVIYPGTFDPITNGHIDIIERASHLFDKIIVGVGANEKKGAFLPYDMRIELTKRVLAKISNVEVRGFSNLLIDFAREQNTFTVIRGLRAISDFEYEIQLAEMNKKLEPRLDTIFFTSYEHYAFISSSLIREIASLGGDVSSFVPSEVRFILDNKFKKKA